MLIQFWLYNRDLLNRFVFSSFVWIELLYNFTEETISLECSYQKLNSCAISADKSRTNSQSHKKRFTIMCIFAENSNRLSRSTNELFTFIRKPRHLPYFTWFINSPMSVQNFFLYVIIICNGKPTIWHKKMNFGRKFQFSDHCAVEIDGVVTNMLN